MAAGRSLPGPKDRHRGCDWRGPTTEEDHHGYHRHLHRGGQRLRRIGSQPRIQRFEVERDTLMSMVAQGYGITLTSEAAAQASFPGVVFRHILDEPEPVTFSALWSPHNRSRALLDTTRTAPRDTLVVEFRTSTELGGARGNRAAMTVAAASIAHSSPSFRTQSSRPRRSAQFGGLLVREARRNKDDNTIRRRYDDKA
jgi:hypothetical protein